MKCVHLESGGEERSSETESEERDHVETEFGTVGLIYGQPGVVSEPYKE